MANSADPDLFAQLLTEAVQEIKRRESKQIGVIQDELGYALGKEGGAIIEYWRKRNIPSKQSDLENLVQELIRRGGLKREKCVEFLQCGGHPNPKEFLNPSLIDLPLPIEHFIGRDTEITELLNALRPGHVVTLCGIGGVGKTALVAQVLQRLAADQNLLSQFPHGIFYHDFRSQPSTEAALEQIARFFNEELSPTSRDAAHRALSNCQALLVLDSAEEADELKKLLDIRSKCSVLLISRDKSVAPRRIIELDILSLDQAINLLQAWSTDMQDRTEFQVWSNDQAADYKIATEICELIGQLPLALRIAGRYMSQCIISAPEFLKLLKITPLTILHERESQDQSVPILLAKILETVGQDARNIIGIAGCLAYAPFDLETIATALGRSIFSILPALGNLVRFSIIDRVGSDRYQVVHRLIYLYAQQRITISSEVIVQLANYYTKISEEQIERGATGITKLKSEHLHIMTILDKCVKWKLWEAVLKLGEAIQPYLDIQGRQSELIKTYQDALEAAKALEDPIEEIDLLSKLGNKYHELSQFELAVDYLEQALSLLYAHNTDFLFLEILIDLGKVFVSQGQYQTAREYYQRALDLTQAIGDYRGEGTTWDMLGDLCQKMGHMELAADFYQQALIIFREIGDRQAEATSLASLGDLLYTQRQLESSIEHFQQALIIVRETGDHFREYSILASLGEVYHAQGQYQTAIECFSLAIKYTLQAVENFRQIGDRANEGSNLNTLGGLYLALRQWNEAITYFEQALTVYREISDRSGERIVLHNLGKTYFAQGKYQIASEYFQQALIITPETLDSLLKIEILSLLGDAYRWQGSYDNAILAYEKALELDPNSTYVNQNLGCVYLELRQLDKAKQLYHKRIELHSDNTFYTYLDLGVIALHEGKKGEARRHFKQALNAWAEVSKSGVQIARLLINKALVYLGLEDEEQAFATIKEALKQRQPYEPIDLSTYNLFAELPHPPQILTEISRLLEETLRNED